MRVQMIDIENTVPIGVIRKIDKTTLKDVDPLKYKIVLFAPVEIGKKPCFIIPVIGNDLYPPELLKQDDLSLEELDINLGYPLKYWEKREIINNANAFLGTNFNSNEYISTKTLPDSAYIEIIKEVNRMYHEKELSDNEIKERVRKYNDEHLKKEENNNCILDLKTYIKISSNKNTFGLDNKIKAAMSLSISNDMDERFDDILDSSNSVNLFVPFKNEEVFKVEKIRAIGVHRVVCVETREDIDEPKVLFIAKVKDNNDIYFSCYKDIFEIINDRDFYSNNDIFIELFDLEGFPHLYFITPDTSTKSQPFSRLSNKEIKKLKIRTRDYIFNLKEEEKKKVNNLIKEKITKKASYTEECNSSISTILYFDYEEGLND